MNHEVTLCLARRCCCNAVRAKAHDCLSSPTSQSPTPPMVGTAWAVSTGLIAGWFFALGATHSWPVILVRLSWYSTTKSPREKSWGFFSVKISGGEVSREHRIDHTSIMLRRSNDPRSAPHWASCCVAASLLRRIRHDRRYRLPGKLLLFIDLCKHNVGRAFCEGACVMFIATPITSTVTPTETQIVPNFAHTTFGRVAAAAVVLGLVACQNEAPTASDPARTPVSFAVGDVTTSTPEFGKIKVCKSASSNVSGDFTFSRSAVGASGGTVSGNRTIVAAECRVVAEDIGGDDVGSNVSITETSAGLVSITGQRIDNPGAVVSNQPFTNGGTLFVNSFHGFTITFDNFVAPPPPPGNNGCSPGYWKNHNFPNGYSSSTKFADVFNNNVYGNATMLTVLKTGGGGLAALGRQTVSAYFNAIVYADFGYSAMGVIDAFNAVVPGTSAAQNSLKDAFEDLTDVDGRICTNPTGK